jgi:CheY-like chemotaxis protein
VLSVVLEKCDATVTTASSAHEALELFGVWKPDLLVCDFGTPELDGYVNAIRELPPEKGRDTPAIALTGYARLEARSRALGAGNQMFVPKPIEASELCSITANVVSDNVST